MSIDSPMRAIRSTQTAPLIIGISALGLLVLLLHGTAAEIVLTWYRSVTFQHGFLIIPICAYLAWLKRDEVAATPISPEPWGVAIVAGTSIVWLIGHATATLLVEETSMIAIGEAIFFTMFGRLLCRVLVFPLGYLWFAIPVGLELVPMLRDHTASMTVFLLKFVGVPVYSDGNLIQIPGQDFYVAEACSGIRYLIASTALGVLIAGLTYRSWWRRGSFVAASIIVPIFANGLRAFTIILLAYYVDARLAGGIDHLIYGWVFFSVVTFITIAIGMSFREDPKLAAGVGSGSISGGDEHPGNLRRLLLAGLVAFAPVILICLYSQILDSQILARDQAVGEISLQQPLAKEPWHLVLGMRDPAPPSFAGRDEELDAGYVSNDRRGYLTVGYYTHNRQNAKAVNSQHDLFPRWGTMVTASGTTNIVIDGKTISARYERSTTDWHKRTLLLFYWVDGRFTGNPYFAKILEAKVKILGGQRAAAAIALSVDYNDATAVAEQGLRDLASNLRGLDKALEGASK